MVIITDSREQDFLEFNKTDGVEFKTACLPCGDYMAEGQMVTFERKSVNDLWSSYTHGYERERTKILKAKELGLKFILAIEDTCFNIRRGYSYQKDGEEIESKVDGYSMIKKLFTIQRKYEIQCWFCPSRKEMAHMILEYFLAYERVKI